MIRLSSVSARRERRWRRNWQSRVKKVALIEKDARMYGGTCINVGCIPSKRLVLEAERAPAHDFEVQSEYYHVAVQEKKETDNSTPYGQL